MTSRGGIGAWLANNCERLALGEYPIDTEDTDMVDHDLSALTDALTTIQHLPPGLPAPGGVRVYPPSRYGPQVAEVAVGVDTTEQLHLWAAALTVDPKTESTPAGRFRWFETVLEGDHVRVRVTLGPAAVAA